MKDVFKLVLTVIRQTRKFFKNGTEAGSPSKSDAWDGLLERLTGSEKYGQAAGLRAMCKQVRDATRVSEPHKAEEAKTSGGATTRSEKSSKSKTKRKVGEVEVPLEAPQKRKKKKTKVVTEVS
jgi:hypothetical protein